jgi:hypothetical protein
VIIEVINNGKEYVAALAEFESLEPSVSKVENEETLIEFPVLKATSLLNLLELLNKAIRKELELKFSI